MFGCITAAGSLCSTGIVLSGSLLFGCTCHSCGMSVAAGRGACAPGGTVQGRHLERRKYGIMKFDRSWRINICIFYTPNTPLTHPSFDTTPLNSMTPHKAVRKPRNLHYWSDWSFTCYKTVEDPYCPVTVLLTIAIQCSALFTCFQIILHIIRKSCMKFGHLIPKKIFTFVATRCQILRLKCTKFNFGWGSVQDPTGGAYSAPQA